MRPITQSDAHTLSLAAHRLKSSSAILGVMTLAELCGQLEMMGREQNLANAPTTFAKAESKYAESIKVLAAYAYS